MLATPHAMRYVETPVRETKQKDLRIISEMKTWRILWYLANRHRVGLLTLGNLALLGYLAWDKFLHIFF